MSRYAEGTTVTPEKSRAELTRLLERYGATHLIEMRDTEQLRYIVQFEMRGRWYRFKIEARPALSFYREKDRYHMPSREYLVDNPEWYKPHWAELERRRIREWARQWRVLLKRIQMKFETVLDEAMPDGTADQKDADRDSTFDAEMLPYLLLPEGDTFAERYAPQVGRLYSSGDGPEPLQHLLPPPRDSR